MTTRTITFKRSFSGRTVNLWVHHPNGVTEKLIFTNSFASSSLSAGEQYVLLWVAAGEAGSTLSVQRRAEGEPFADVVKDWKIPPRAGSAAGQILVRTDQKDFLG